MSASIAGSKKLPTEALRLHALNVGHGDALLVQFPAGTWGLVDAGSDSRSRPAGPLVLRYLAAWGVRHLAFVCVTHPHEDHDNGIEAVLESPLEIGEFWRCDFRPVPGRDGIRPGWQRYMEAALRRRDQGRLTMPPAWHQGEVRELDGVRLSCLGPTPALVEQAVRQWRNPNNASLVLALAWEGRSVLLGADAERQAWEVAVLHAAAADLPRAEVFKVPHHGSRRGLPPIALPGMVDTAAGYAAVVTCGSEARFPDRPVIAALLRTRGAVACTTPCQVCPHANDGGAATGAEEPVGLTDLALAAMGGVRPRGGEGGRDALIVSLPRRGPGCVHAAEFSASGIRVRDGFTPCEAAP